MDFYNGTDKLKYNDKDGIKNLFSSSGLNEYFDLELRDSFLSVDSTSSNTIVLWDKNSDKGLVGTKSGTIPRSVMGEYQTLGGKGNIALGSKIKSNIKPGLISKTKEGEIISLELGIFSQEDYPNSPEKYDSDVQYKNFLSKLENPNFQSKMEEVVTTGQITDSINSSVLPKTDNVKINNALPKDQDILKRAKDLQSKVDPSHSTVSGITDIGLFGGTDNKLNIDLDGNIILTRVAPTEEYLTKGWEPVNSLEELKNTSEFHGGGGGLPTSGFIDENNSFIRSYGKDSLISKFKIPEKDFLAGIVEGNIYLGNIGEGEFVLNPYWAKNYLSSINGEAATITKDGKIISEGLKEPVDSLSITVPIEQQTQKNISSESSKFTWDFTANHTDEDYHKAVKTLTNKFPSSSALVEKMIDSHLGAPHQAFNFLLGLENGDKDSFQEIENFNKKRESKLTSVTDKEKISSPKTIKKIYAGADSNIPVEIIDNLIDDEDRNWKGYKTVDNQFVEAERLFDSNKEADEYIFNKQKNKKVETPPQSSKASVASNAQGQSQATKSTHTGTTTSSTSTKSSAKPNSQKPPKQVHKEIHREVQQNSLSQFFKDKERLKAFDIETTSLLNKGKNYQNRAKIWQIGLAVDSDTQEISGHQTHTNPFFSFDKNNKVSKVTKTTKDAEKSLRTSNGRFSERAFSQGNFTGFLKDYNTGKIESLDSALKSMFDKVNKSDVLVLQNMNFENKTLKSQVEMGILSRDTYNHIANKMNSVSLNKQGEVLHLFERPFEVQRKMRRADLIFNTEYMFSRDNSSFKEYRELLNSAMSSYAESINNPKREGAVAIELMDITKSFLANAAEKGYIEKETVGLGLNLDFLSQAMYGKMEEHTALADADLTNKVFKDLWSMNEELIHGTESEGTKAVLSNIKAAQPEEVNKRFISTVRSVLDDFLTTGETNLSNRMAWYNPEVALKEGNDIKVLPEVKTIHKESTKDIDQAMKDVLKRYSHFTENIDGFSREAYIDNLLNLGRNPNNGLPSLNDMFKKADEDYFEGISSNSNILNENSSIINPTNKSSVIKEETKSWFKGKKGLALGAIGGGLLYMAMQSKPEPIEKNTDNVSENFYDEQYLGSAFVDFRERNKHYMM